MMTLSIQHEHTRTWTTPAQRILSTPQPHLLFVSASALASPLFHAWTRPEHWTWFITGYVFVEQER